LSAAKLKILQAMILGAFENRRFSMPRMLRIRGPAKKLIFSRPQKLRFCRPQTHNVCLRVIFRNIRTYLFIIVSGTIKYHIKES